MMFSMSRPLASLGVLVTERLGVSVLRLRDVGGVGDDDDSSLSLAGMSRLPEPAEDGCFKYG